MSYLKTLRKKKVLSVLNGMPFYTPPPLNGIVIKQVFFAASLMYAMDWYTYGKKFV